MNKLLLIKIAVNTVDKIPVTTIAATKLMIK